MNTLSDIHPGKLKRKAKKSPNMSVVDMPVVSGQPSSGNLLGDMLLDQGFLPFPIHGFFTDIPLGGTDRSADGAIQ